MNVSRRWFIGGAASFGALQGCRVLSGSSLVSGRPNLTFGVVSDIHIIAENVDYGGQGNTRALRHAFRWFDSQGVDGVMIAGDMADAGLLSQLQCVADAWNAVFPGNVSRLDGRPVEKLFIYGNHDWEGFHYNYTIFGRPSKSLTSDHLCKFGMKKAWEEVFEEEYSPVYRKTVKGYDFVGAHWDGTAGANWQGAPAITPWFEAHGREIDPKKPFFFFQHPHPKDTCYGSLAWGHDDGTSTRALSKFRNAVAFSGHSHYSLLDERTIWQGAFTSIGTGSLRYAGSPYIEIPGAGFENLHANDRKLYPDSEKFMSSPIGSEQRSGMLLRVYDDAITVERRDFLRDVDLGPDWTIPLPVAEPKPFAFAEHAKKFTAPVFPSASVAKAKLGKAKPRNGKNEVPVVNLTFTAAAQSFAARTWRYEVVAEDLSGKKILTRHILSPDYHLPVSEAVKEITLPVAVAKLQAGAEIRFRVRACNCFGKASEDLVSNVVRVNAEKKNA